MALLKNYFLCLAVLAAGISAVMPTNVLAKSPKAQVPGNNGTIKVHEKDTPSATESNDPKVCVFNFEGFGFDKGQTGVVVITTQGGGDDKSEVKQVNLPTANENGYTESTYVTVADGHYKTTVYGKDVHGNIDYDMELKAKSKVIKVECSNPPETPTTPVKPDNNPPAPVPVPTPKPKPIIPVVTTKPTQGTILADAAYTTKPAAKGSLPSLITATGLNPLQILFNTLFAGLGAYTALLRRK